MKTIILTAALLIASCPAFAGPAVKIDKNPHGIQWREKKPAEKSERVTLEVAQAAAKKYKRLLDAIQKVETGGEKDPANAKGDKGKALGYFQIHRDYFCDAASQAQTGYLRYDKDCRDAEKSRVIVVLYWRKWAKSWSDRDLALMHHYGPSGLPGTDNNKKDPDKYWDKVKKVLK